MEQGRLTRRSFLKQGGLVTVGLTLGISAINKSEAAGATITSSRPSGADFYKKLYDAILEISKDAQRLYRNCERSRLRAQVTEMFPKCSGLMSLGAKPDHKYLVALLDEEGSDLQSRYMSFEDVTFFSAEHAAVQAVRDYDKQDRVAVYVGIESA